MIATEITMKKIPKETILPIRQTPQVPPDLLEFHAEI
jgi:hypothetical protein